MKVALVNLCKIEDISLLSSFSSDISFLNENQIEYVDYASGKNTREDLLKGFHDALKDKTVGLVWFVQGGNSLISFIENIDWDLVVSSEKKFLGISDFTHFSMTAVSKGVKCYYGLALKKIKKYYSEDNLARISNFLKLISGQNIIPDENENYYSLDNIKITGGHLTSLIFMIEHYRINLKNTVLFIEHHYIPGENFDDLAYYIDQLLITIKENKPESIILGHTILFDENNNEINFNEINDFFSKRLVGTGIPVSSVDHFIKPILFG